MKVSGEELECPTCAMHVLAGPHDRDACKKAFSKKGRPVTNDDKKRLKTIRDYCKCSGALYVPDMQFLLAQIDKRDEALRAVSEEMNHSSDSYLCDETWALINKALG